VQWGRVCCAGAVQQQRSNAAKAACAGVCVIDRLAHLAMSSLVYCLTPDVDEAFITACTRSWLNQGCWFAAVDEAGRR